MLRLYVQRFLFFFCKTKFYLKHKYVTFCKQIHDTYLDRLNSHLALI